MSDLFERVDIFGPEYEKERERRRLNEECVKSMANPKENWVHLQDTVWDLLRHSPTLTQKDRDILGWIDTVCVAQRDRCNREGWKNFFGLNDDSRRKG